LADEEVRPIVTLTQIAKAVGVSNATVSRVLNFDATLSVTAETRQAVIETAEALNYATPRNRNRNRASAQGVGKIALAHFLRPEQELVDPYYVALRLGVESRCHLLKLETVKVYRADDLPAPSLLKAASGVIAIGQHSAREIAWLRQHSRNLVFADFRPESDELDSVQNDYASATAKLLDALAALDYRRIAFAGWVEGSTGQPFGEPRCRAYLAWMRARGLDGSASCLTERNTEESGYRLGRRLLGEGPRPDALVTANDNMAVGAYRAAHELGLRIPEEVALASFNDISVAKFLNPPLTTVRLPAEEIGETAVEMLLERIGGRALGKRVTLASQIIWRASSRRPPSAKTQR